MRLTRFTDNALRCLIYLARAPGRTPTVSEVAAGMGMSHDHLLKVVRRLVELGLVRTIRGRHGGLVLARSPQDICVADVVRSTEDNLTIVSCFDPAGTDCPIAEWCTLAGALSNAMSAFFAVLERLTLADIVRPALKTPPRPTL